MVDKLRKYLREPLAHFLVLGGLIFAGYSLMTKGKGANGEPGEIVITQGQLASMGDAFVRKWQRTPTPEEWEAMIQDRVRDEVYYREALALGLDKDDQVIRRRLRQKMEFVTDDAVAQSLPTDAELNAYLHANPEKFRLGQQFTFHQLFLNPDKHGKNLAHDAAQLVDRLNRAGGDSGFATMGDALMLDNHFTAASVGEVTKQFGAKFAAKLSELPAGQWQGPVESAFGAHVVLLVERTPGRIPPLDEIRAAVTQARADDHRLEAKDKAYREMLKHYAVVVDKPESVRTK